MSRRLFCGHAESVWMPRIRFVARLLPWLGLGLLLGAFIDSVVRFVA